MKELYRKDLANHPGPEPCEGGRKTALEALDRGICRLAMELRNQPFRDAHGVGIPEATRRRTLSRVRSGPAESKTPCMQRNFKRENRETPSSPARQWGGPEGEREERQVLHE
jgi:hypothetical protein